MRSPMIKTGMILLGASLAQSLISLHNNSASAGYRAISYENFQHCHAFGDERCVENPPPFECYLCEFPYPISKLSISETAYEEATKSCGRKKLGECVDIMCDTSGSEWADQCYDQNVKVVVAQPGGGGGSK